MDSEEGPEPILDRKLKEELKQLFSVGEDCAERQSLPCYGGEGWKEPDLGASSSGSHVVEGKRRDYPCRYCEKKFTQSGHRNEHECKFHLHIGHWCETCHKIFGAKSKLDRHIRNVHGIARSYKCWCGKDFKEKYYLSRHMKTHDRKRSPSR